MFAQLPFALALSLGLSFQTALAQLQQAGTNDAVRVTLSVNPDGSRTAYEFDPANKKAVATTTTDQGQPQGKIVYKLDDAGRFASGDVFGANGKLRFKTSYKYDPAGRLQEESQLTTEGVLEHRIVYSYNAAGKQTGYTVYDAAGKVIGQTTPKAGAAR